MNKYWSISIIVLMMGCSQFKAITGSNTYDKRLIGTWVSDKNRTVEWLRENRNFSDPYIEKISKIYGRLKLTLTEKKVISEYGGNVEEQKREILAIEGDTVAVREVDALSNYSEVIIIRIENEDSFSIYHNMLEIREYFKRIQN